MATRSRLKLSMLVLVLVSACGSGGSTVGCEAQRVDPDLTWQTILERTPLESAIGPLVNGEDFRVVRKLELLDDGRAVFTARIDGSEPADVRREGTWHLVEPEAGTTRVAVTFGDDPVTVTVQRTGDGRVAWVE